MSLLPDRSQDVEYWRELVLLHQVNAHKYRSAIETFVDKNFHGGAKSDREDYTVMVSCKDIWDLREALRNEL